MGSTGGLKLLSDFHNSLAYLLIERIVITPVSFFMVGQFSKWLSSLIAAAVVSIRKTQLLCVLIVQGRALQLIGWVVSIDVIVMRGCDFYLSIRRFMVKWSLPHKLFASSDSDFFVTWNCLKSSIIMVSSNQKRGTNNNIAFVSLEAAIH